MARLKYYAHFVHHLVIALALVNPKFIILYIVYIIAFSLIAKGLEDRTLPTPNSVKYIYPVSFYLYLVLFMALIYKYNSFWIGFFSTFLAPSLALAHECSHNSKVKSKVFNLLVGLCSTQTDYDLHRAHHQAKGLERIDFFIYVTPKTADFFIMLVFAVLSPTYAGMMVGSRLFIFGANYTQHYGIYGIERAWNQDSTMAKYNYLMLNRHDDHHRLNNKRWYDLKYLSESYRSPIPLKKTIFISYLPKSFKEKVNKKAQSLGLKNKI